MHGLFLCKELNYCCLQSTFSSSAPVPDRRFAYSFFLLSASITSAGLLYYWLLSASAKYRNYQSIALVHPGKLLRIERNSWALQIRHLNPLIVFLVWSLHDNFVLCGINVKNVDRLWPWKIANSPLELACCVLPYKNRLWWLFRCYIITTTAASKIYIWSAWSQSICIRIKQRSRLSNFIYPLVLSEVFLLLPSSDQ